MSFLQSQLKPDVFSEVISLWLDCNFNMSQNPQPLLSPFTSQLHSCEPTGSSLIGLMEPNSVCRQPSHWPWTFRNNPFRLCPSCNPLQVPHLWLHALKCSAIPNSAASMRYKVSVGLDSLDHSLKGYFMQKQRINLGFTSYVSLLSRIIILPYLLYSV